MRYIEFSFFTFLVSQTSKKHSFAFFNHSFLRTRRTSKPRISSFSNRSILVKNNETSTVPIKLKKNIINPLRSFQGSKSRVQDNRKGRLGRVIKEASFHAGTISKRAGKNALGFSSSLRFPGYWAPGIDRIGSERNRRNRRIIKVEFLLLLPLLDRLGVEGGGFHGWRRFGAYLRGWNEGRGAPLTGNCRQLWSLRHPVGRPCSTYRPSPSATPMKIVQLIGIDNSFSDWNFLTSLGSRGGGGEERGEMGFMGKSSRLEMEWPFHIPRVHVDGIISRYK